MSFNKLALSCFCLLFLTGCIKRLSKDKAKNEVSDIACFQAKLIDIPIPLDSEQILSGISANSYAFYSKDILQSIIHFYEIEMEFLGWQKIAEFIGFESLLVFEKPNKKCIISVRPEKKVNNIFIFLTS